MSFYKSPAEMFSSRGDKYIKEGNYYWAMAKNGYGDHYYGKAKSCYREAAINNEKSAQAKSKRITF